MNCSTTRLPGYDKYVPGQRDTLIPGLLGDGTTDVFVGFCAEAALGTAGYHDLQVIRMSDGLVLHNFMIDLGPGGGNSGHMSGRGYKKPGWILFSWYYDGSTSTGPGVFSLEINAINLDTGEVRRIVHDQSIGNTDYFAEPHATVNPSFNKIMWGSNWRTPRGEVDTYAVDLP